MDARSEIEALVEFDGRWPGTDAERRAASHLGRRLEELGREVEVESVDAWPNWPLAYASHVLLAILGSIVSVESPFLGTALVAVAVILTVGDATGTFLVTRRLLGRRASQNVLSPEGGEKPGTLVLVAHYDAGRGGIAFGRRLEERRAVVGNLLRRPIGPLDPIFWSMLLILLCTVLRIVGLGGTLLTAVQFVPTVVLVLSLPLLVDIALSNVVPGANDNASGVAQALRLTERFGGSLEHFDLWVLLTGSQEALSHGMRGFLRRHKKQLERERTVFLNLDELGAGTVRYTRSEGLLVGVKSHLQLVELCEEIAEDDREGDDAFGARALRSRRASDGYAARTAGYPAITIACRNVLDYAPDHHLQTDTPDRIDDAALERSYGFCCELIQRLDRAIGPDLAAHEDRTMLAEGDETS